MHYYEHALLSAKKFGCAVEDTLQLHQLMDSSKFFFPASQHRLFSHNTWFIQVLTQLTGDVIPNSLNGQMLSTRDILYEHAREDHNGRVPTLQDWLRCIDFNVGPEDKTWFNNPRAADRLLVRQLKVEQFNK